MGIIRLPGFTQATQPQSGPAQIDWPNPITRGLLTAMPLALTGYDAADPTNNPSLIGSPAKAATAKGVGPALNGSNQTVRLSKIIPATQTTGTMFVLGWFPAATQGTIAGQSSDAAGNNEVTFRNGFANFMGITQPMLAGSPTTWPAGMHSYAATWSPSDLITYSDGIAPFGSSGLHPTTSGDINYPFQLGGYYYSGGNIFLVAYTPLVFLMWNRVLSPNEIAKISANPWQLFKSPQRVMMAAAAGIQFDAASNSGYQAAQSTYSFNRTVTGSNTFLAVDIELLSVPGTTVTGITDNGVAMTFIGAQSTVSGAGRVEQWGIVNPASGTHAIAVTLSASINSAGTATSYTGVHQTAPTEAFNGAQATNVGAADASVVITTIADNCYVHAAVSTNDMAITAGQVSRNNVSGAAGSGANEDNGASKTPAGAVTMTYTGVDALATWAIAGYAIRPLAASTPATGTFASTLANATMAASGVVTDVGSFASTLGNMTMAASGSVGVAPSGTFASTLAGFTMAATGTINDTGAFASTLGGVSMAAAGTVAPNVTGTFASTMGDVTMSAGGYIGTPPVMTGVIVRRRLRPRVFQRTAAP